ncbi:MAG: hypothetical protein QM767_19990 [Anaeromyxobacter sp.]
MRALLAAGLAVFLALTAAAPHVHSGPAGTHGCAVCVAGSSDVATSSTPDVAPPTAWPEREVAVPAASPVTGAPLGAIPGQSPPISS